MKKSLPLLLLILAEVSAYAQSNFQEGYVITQQGDTLRGQVDNRDWRTTPTEITFRSAVGQVETYGPTDLSEFYIQPTSEQFLARTLSIDALPFGLEELVQLDSPTQAAVQRQQRTEAVFLRVLVDEGPARLLFQQGKSDKPHFFLEKEGQIRELIFQRFLLKNTSQLLLNSLYKDQLNSYLADCPEITKRISTVDYEQNQLIRLITAYNRCKGVTIAYAHPEKGRWAFEVLAGVEFSQLTFKGVGGPIFLRAISLSSSTSPTIGLAATFYPPRSRGQLGYRLETLFRTYEARGVGEGVFDEYDIQFKLSYLRINALLRYTYPKGKVRPFLGAGLANGLTLSRVNHQKLRSTIFQNEGEALPSPRGWEVGLMAEAGLSLNRLNLIYRYERTNGFSNLSDLRCSVQLNSVLLSYRFR